MQFWRKNLRTRLLVIFLLLAVIPLAVVGFLAYDMGRQAIIRNTENLLTSVAVLKEQEIKNWVGHLEHTITWLAASPTIRGGASTMVNYPEDDSVYLATHDELAAELDRMADLAHLSPIFILEGDRGQVVASSDTGWEGQIMADRPYFIQGREGIFVSDIFHSLKLGQPTMVVAAPVRDGSGQLLGVLAGHANLEPLNEIMLERSGLGETGETYLVNEGNLLLTDSRFEPGLAFKKWVFTEGVSWALEGEHGVGIYQDYRGKKVIGAYRWVEGRDMALLAEVDRSEAFAPIGTLRATVLRLGSLVTLIVVMVSVLVARTITQPLEKLVEGTEEIGSGNLNYRIQVEARNEIGQLARAFNAMAQNLQKVTASRDDLDREIEERKSVQNALAEAVEELERSNEELQRFAYVASHDLQEPLRMVTSYLQLLERRYGELLEGDAREFIDYAVDGATRMKQLINDLLTYSRVDTRGVSPQPVDMEQVLDDVLDNVKLRLEETRAEIVCHPLPTVPGDKSQLEQLFQNLIDNALKFRGKEPPRIEVGAEKRDGKWVFSVKDNGIGMDPEFQDRVFIIFQRLHTQDEYEGTGIGLAVCKRIVERHGGRIWFESEPGEGTTFYFTIPDQSSKGS